MEEYVLSRKVNKKIYNKQNNRNFGLFLYLQVVAFNPVSSCFNAEKKLQKIIKTQLR